MGIVVVNDIEETEVTSLILKDIIYQMVEDFPDINYLYLDHGFISIKLLKETNNFNAKLIFLKLLFKNIDLSDIKCNQPIEIPFYEDKKLLNKQILFLLPAAIRVDEYQQLEKILKNN